MHSVTWALLKSHDHMDQQSKCKSNPDCEGAPITCTCSNSYLSLVYHVVSGDLTEFKLLSSAVDQDNSGHSPWCPHRRTVGCQKSPWLVFFELFQIQCLDSNFNNIFFNDHKVHVRGGTYSNLESEPYAMSPTVSQTKFPKKALFVTLSWTVGSSNYKIYAQNSLTRCCGSYLTSPIFLDFLSICTSNCRLDN